MLVGQLQQLAVILAIFFVFNVNDFCISDGRQQPLDRENVIQSRRP